ncbi:unnamed protein product [Rhizoctonia solani]|uniref:Uncharacterized protein n=1 Tax=Rhizoctonia solani TaxID=456999 RepID=A0A8H3BYS9_9AGAM|nr:unnamed protein product [Rhizoctonia solani]
MLVGGDTCIVLRPTAIGDEHGLLYGLLQLIGQGCMKDSPNLTMAIRSAFRTVVPIILRQWFGMMTKNTSHLSIPFDEVLQFIEPNGLWARPSESIELGPHLDIRDMAVTRRWTSILGELIKDIGGKELEDSADALGDFYIAAIISAFSGGHCGTEVDHKKWPDDSTTQQFLDILTATKLALKILSPKDPRCGDFAASLTLAIQGFPPPLRAANPELATVVQALYDVIVDSDIDSSIKKNLEDLRGPNGRTSRPASRISSPMSYQ